MGGILYKYMIILTEQQKKDKMEEIHRYCAERDGRCLENEYVNVDKKYKCLCKNGHEFYLHWYRSRKNVWCRKCYHQNRKIIILKNNAEEKMALLHKYCKDHDGECLENKYNGVKNKYKCKCKNEHIFFLQISKISRGDWCAFCSKKRLDSENEMFLLHKFCKDNGAICLENKYKNSKSTYKCICKNGHKINLNWTTCKKTGVLCSICNGTKILPEKEIKLIHEYCKSRGGKCLEDKYKKNGLYRCVCKNKHIFYLCWTNSKYKKYWCRECSGNIVDPIKEMQKIHEFCESLNGKCLENEYKGTNAKYKCICEEGHSFSIMWSHSKHKGVWCPECGTKRAIQTRFKNNMEKIMKPFKKYCEEKGGKCLDKEYIGAKTAYKCTCAKNHVFYLKPCGMKRNQWCPECSIRFGENFTRFILEKIFCYEFPKYKPKYLKNGTGNLELDCFCKELNLACEYQGRQHFAIVSKYGMDEKVLIKRQIYDQFKRDKCKENGIFLIEVPEFYLKFKYFNNIIITPENLVKYILYITKNWREKNNIIINDKIDINEYWQK